jgi:3',5'-cyclic AMP phosphodiesterase CpdA
MQNRQTKRAVRIALLSDTHCTRGTAEDQPLYGGRFAQVMEDILAAGVDFALVAGDLTQDGTPEQNEDFLQEIRRLPVPVRCIAGNHDVGDKPIPGKPGGVTAERVARYEAAFGPSFFLETFFDVLLLGINSSLMGSGLPREQEQWAFLEEMLRRPQPAPPVLLTHYPLALASLEEPGDPYWNIEPEPRRRLATLLEEGGVRLVLSGHLHRPLLNTFGSLLCLTAPPVSFGLPRDRQPCGWILLTLQGEDIHAEPRYLAALPKTSGG